MHAPDSSSLKAAPPVVHRPSLPEAYRSIRIPQGVGRGNFWRKLLAFSGPGYLVAVGYMDPGNWATSLAGGSKFAYTLLSVIIISNFMAIFLQHLALKLGIAGGQDLAQACRSHFNPVANFLLWIACEVAIAACDLAEVIGSAIALNLLFHIPLFWGVCLTALDVMVLLFLQHRGFRWMEAFVISLILVIGIAFSVELILSRPEWNAVLAGCLPTTEIIKNPEMLYIAIGILGATVMPHNLYLHSSIAQTRDYPDTVPGKREAIRFATIDSTVALMSALFINGAILVVSAAVFYRSGHGEVAEIQDAHRLLAPLLGTGLASTVFAIALLASGQNATLTGTLAGQIVMEGFLNLRIPPIARRLITRGIAIIPAVIVTGLYGEDGTAKLLIFSQVILSMQLSFAVFPLVMFTGSKKTMGEFANPLWMQIVAWFLAALIASLNIWLLVQTFRQPA